MAKIISILASVMTFGLSATTALAYGGPLTEQQKKDFLGVFKSVGRVERLYSDAQGRKTPKSDEVYEKMYTLVQQACQFIENKSEKDSTLTVTLESTEIGCPVVMKSIEQVKNLGDGVSAIANKVVFQAGDLMKAINDVIETQDLLHGKIITTKNEEGGVITSDEKSEGFVVSQLHGKSDYTTRSVSSSEYVGNFEPTKINGEWTLNTKLGEINVEMKITYKLEDGVFTKEIFLNGEKIEIGTELEKSF
ncbi:MAG: hypothetical protein SGJ18_09155 [Pseudomonadota bacterium]|nr:hypothetical protein [Pseudomonadota bacterium]